ALVVQVVQLDTVEAKTRLPAKYDRLDLGDPKAKDSRAKEVVLIDSSGKTLADLVVGKRKFTLGSKEGGVYVRVPPDGQAWLAQGDLDPGTTPRDWLKRDIAIVGDMEIRRISVTHPDGSKVIVERATPAESSFKIANLPHHQEPESE